MEELTLIAIAIQKREQEVQAAQQELEVKPAINLLEQAKNVWSWVRS